MPQGRIPPLRILYGLPSEGMGHATRSKVTIQYLLSQGHIVKVATSDRAAEFLKDFDILEIKGLHLKYEAGKVSKFDSMVMNMKPEMLKVNFAQLRKANKDFMPDICISDYDSFTYVFAKTHGIPILCLDNIQFCARYALDINVPAHLKSDLNMCRHLTEMKCPGCDRYLVISAWSGNPIKPDTYKVPPVLRDVILEARPTTGNHILVYQTSSSQSNLVPELQKIPDVQFFVYGFNKDENNGNVILKSFSEMGFVNDLATCRAVITNGGHSLISEAIYLHKPLCCFPIVGQFEQYLNAAYVEKMGYGRVFEVFTGESVREFLQQWDRYQAAVNQYHQDGNHDVFRAVDQFLIDFNPHRTVVPPPVTAGGHYSPGHQPPDHQSPLDKLSGKFHHHH